MKKCSLLISFIIVVSGLNAQELIPMGAWRSHFNYEETSLVARTTNNVFAATPHGLIYYDPDDQSINKLSKVDGINDVGITAMAFDAEEDHLVLGYQNGNIDIISDEGIANLPVLLQSDVSEDKRINHIDFREGKIHLSTDFGLLILNTDNKVEEAYFNLGESGETLRINASEVFNNKIYLATEDGVLSADLSGNLNLQDFNNWERFEGSVVEALEINSVLSGNGAVYVATSTAIFKWNDSNWSNILIPLDAEEEIVKIKPGLNRPIVLTNQKIFLLSSEDSFVTIERPSDASIRDIEQESEEIFWYADDQNGLSKLEQGNSENIVLDGPSTQLASLKIVDEDLYAFPELSTNYFTSVTNSMGYSIFQNGVWQVVKPSNLNGFSNITDVELVNEETFVSSFGNGILNLSTGDVQDFTNSPLDENQTGTENTLVSGILRDNDHNIWVSNFSSYPLMRWDGAEDWTPYEFGSSASTEPVKSAINRNNQIWMILGLLDGRGLVGFDIESNIYRYVTSTNTNLPSNRVNDLAFGQQDEIWIATDQGIVYFPFSFGIIEDQTIDVTVPIFEESVLFENNPVYALEVDGGNRIWVGSNDGLWLFSENIQELVYHFDVDNSPLPSNKVIDLELNPETGELFILTDEGLVSYRTNSTEGTNIHQQVQIYPNPVLPDFEGWVGFSGLVENARLKVTTISGQLVRELSSFGGGASWDVLDYNGRKVDSGIYLVFSASSDGEETFVGKIAVVR